MGVYWRSTMPLLSTLAALVIIVHSAEEDLEDYGRELRPRIMETDTTNYDVPWRAVKVEPMMTHSTQSDTWEGSLEDPPKRRRPIRKRRRRPQAALRGPQERNLQPEKYRAYNIDNYRPLTELPHRRRKKIDTKGDGWNGRTESPRPFRRKGPKRTSDQESWHEFSEFGDVPADENFEVNVASPKHETTNYDAEVENNESHEPRLTLNQFYNEEKNRNVYATGEVAVEEDEEEPSQFPGNKDNEYEEQNNPEIRENKSLSEFSLESGTPVRMSRNKNEEVPPAPGNINDVTEQSKPLDPVSLKDILQKSKGKSLSELLVQHNLTLADLLSGEKNALSVLKTTELPQTEKDATVEQSTTTTAPTTKTSTPFTSYTHSVFENSMDDRKENNLEELTSSEEIFSTTIRYTSSEPVTTTVVTAKSSTTNIFKLTVNSSIINQTNNVSLNETDKISKRRRYPTGIRINLRMRPLSNNSYKGQLSRDMITSTTRRYQNNNFAKFRQWKELIPAIKNNTQLNRSEEDTYNVTTTSAPEEITTTEFTFQFNTINTQSSDEAETETVNTDTTPTPTTTIATVIETTTNEKSIAALKQSVFPRVRSRQNITNLRQQAFANRLKNLKLRHKISMNKTSPEHLLKELFDMANLVSASEFIAKIQPKPNNSRDDLNETATMLEDFMTTEATTKPTIQKSIKRSRPREKKLKPASATKVSTIVSTTEEAAKIEIEEILHDSLTSAKLSRILKERNMTLNELVEHRERGSSHVHLADIFHNASREPNPPEPFLSKSLLEPISKETYPLRALLEANAHNSTTKPITTVPYITQTEYISIPMMMDFGNNVNENGENTGIPSLLSNFTIETNTNKMANNHVKNDEKIGTSFTNRTSRQSRGNEGDLITLNEIFSLMQRSQNITDDILELSSNETSSDLTVKKIVLQEDINGDGLILLEDVKGINDIDHNTSSNEKIEFKSLESQENTPFLRSSETINNNTRSVTVVTASIVGLIAVLFLLTYATYKWKHQQQMFHRKYGASEDRIPSPVFENRMTNKTSSMRSMSPMLSSNIYSIDTLEKSHNNECPEYTWDSLRKPYQ